MEKKPKKTRVEDVIESVYEVLATDISKLIISSCVDSADDPFSKSLKTLPLWELWGVYFLYTPL